MCRWARVSEYLSSPHDPRHDSRPWVTRGLVCGYAPSLICASAEWASTRPCELVKKNLTSFHPWQERAQKSLIFFRCRIKRNIHLARMNFYYISEALKNPELLYEIFRMILGTVSDCAISFYWAYQIYPSLTNNYGTQANYYPIRLIIRKMITDIFNTGEIIDIFHTRGKDKSTVLKLN